MNAIVATFVRVQTLADGSPRVVLDCECTMAELAALGLIPGTPFALARITPEAAQQAAQQQTIEQAPADDAKGGALAKLAGMWCADPKFQHWLGAGNEGDAAAFIRGMCDISSRAELDHDAAAAKLFNEHFRLPYMAFCQGRNHG